MAALRRGALSQNPDLTHVINRGQGALSPLGTLSDLGKNNALALITQGNFEDAPNHSHFANSNSVCKFEFSI